jgi:inorganic triphosphatase YgiF
MDHELELKFRVPAETVASLRQVLRARGARPLRLRATYFDTPDGRLAAQRAALRLRQEGRRWVQTLKAEGASAVQRLEHEVSVPAAAGRPPALDPARHQGHLAYEVFAAALGDVQVDALVPRLETDVQRLRCELQHEGTRIELALDLGEIRAGGRSLPVAELEMERLDGPATGLFALAAQWMPHGGLWLSTESKAAAGERLLRGDAPADPAKAQPPEMARDAAGAALLRAMLNCTLQQVLANASEVAEGRDEAERVHQLRVGLRRLRTVLRELQPLSPAIDPAWEPELAEVFAELGEVRDDEAVADAVRPLLMAAGAPSSDWAPRAPTDLAAVVRRTGFQLTLLRLLALAHADDEHLSSAGPADTRRFVAQQLAELHRQVSRAGKRFERLTLEQQHRARKRLKRLRYLAELAQPLWPRKAVQRYLEALEPAQGRRQGACQSTIFRK